jgi:RNA polymerase sigma factor (sigma-70 family)
MQDSLTLQRPPVSTEISDVQLLEAWVKHQRQADFTEIVRRHLALVQGTARRQLDQNSSEDIAQQVFAILARKASSLSGLRSLGAWLHQVTLLECRRAVRGRIRERRNQEAAMYDLKMTDARDPLAEALPYLDAAIAGLSASDRDLILLRYSEGLTFSQAAKRTGRKEAALRQQASRALEKLSGILRRRGVCVPAATLTTGLGLHLAGSSTASAALVVSAAALSSAGGISGLSLAGITFLIMNTKQSIAGGALLAALLVTGPVAWRATQIRQAEKSLAAVSPAPTARNTEKTAAKGAELFPPPENVKSARIRFAKPLSEADRNNMMAAIPQILEANIKAAVSEWCERDAWLEARNTAAKLGLSDAIEAELRQFLVSEHTKETDKLGSGDEKADRATRRREGDARRDAWFASRLNPQQMASLQNLNEAKDVALAEKLAASALRQMSENLDLTVEQKSQLHDAAFAKATRSVEEKDYFNQFGFSGGLDSGDQQPIEEKSEDFVRSILTFDQQKLWNVMLVRDRAFSMNIQKGMLGGIIEQLKKVQPTSEELRNLAH